MAFAYPKETYYINYLLKDESNRTRTVKILTDTENVEWLYKAFELGCVTKENIDELISYAIEHKKSEIQRTLLKYKNDNFNKQ